MSTKIYNAYKVKNMNLFELLKYFQEMRKEILQKYTNEHLINFDRVQMDKESEELDFVDDVLSRLKKLDDTNTDDPYDPKKFYVVSSVVVYPHKNENLYVHFFNVRQDILKEYIEDNSHFEDFHYQNSTDMSNFDMKKENINTMSTERKKELEDEWEHREEIWDDLLPYMAIPVENGFTFIFTDKESISRVVFEKNMKEFSKWRESKK